MERVKTDFSPAECIALINLCNCDSRRARTWTAICRELNVNTSHPIYRKMLAHLLQVGIVHVEAVDGSRKLLKIRQRRLRDLIDEANHINFLLDEYLARYHEFVW